MNHWGSTKDRCSLESYLNAAAFDITQMFMFANMKLFSEATTQSQCVALIGTLMAHRATTWLK
tara:strand:- start:193 stop:381 length:189 start_codon:yes stop_codon:yes gene_type:complete